MSKSFEQFSLSKGLRLRIGNEGRLYASISNSSGEFYVAPEVLFILCQIEKLGKKRNLQTISKNLTLACKNILENLPNAQECELLLKDLEASGLIINTQKNTSRYLQEDGFGDCWIQWAMISDSVRSQAYEKAILKCINSKSVVADVGAGSGFLTAACLKAGAKRVVAIEETQIAQKIIPILNLCKLPTQKEKLTVLNLNSFDASFPHDVTHIVSELFGNDPFQEGVIPTLREVGKNFTKQPIYIPLRVEVYFELIDILAHPIKHRVLAYQLNKTPNTFLSAAKKLFSLDKISFPVALEQNNFKRISKPIELGKMPLNPPPLYTNLKTHPLYGQKKIKVAEKSTCCAGLLWFRVYLTESITISSHPLEQDAAQHWSPLLFLMDKLVHKNDEIIVSYELNEMETGMCCSMSRA